MNSDTAWRQFRIANVTRNYTPSCVEMRFWVKYATAQKCKVIMGTISADRNDKLNEVPEWVCSPVEFLSPLRSNDSRQIRTILTQERVREKNTFCTLRVELFVQMNTTIDLC